VRENLDPFGEHDDEAIWRALEHSALKTYISSLEGKLDGVVSQGARDVPPASARPGNRA